MSRRQGSMVIRAPAKINLRLHVLGRRPNGYHDVCTLMQQVDLCDHIEIQAAVEGIHLSCEGADLPQGEGNLAFKAARLLAQAGGKRGGASIRLLKRIPLAAGLGGGSSDAAAVVQGLNKLWNVGLPRAELMRLALELGADVPFFIFGHSAVATGVGEVLQPLPAPLPAWTYVLVNPRFPVSTQWAYQSLKMELTTPKTQISIKEICEKMFPVGDWLFNDLETPVISRFPVIHSIKETLKHWGAEGALMSGSGPTVFGVFTSEALALSAAEAIRAGHPWDVFVARGWEGESCSL